jgi:hypothetical protein
MLGIPYQEKNKYYTNCPKCNGHSSSLMVTIDSDFVRYKCMREGQCDWNEGKYFKNNSNIKPEPSKPREPIFIPDDLKPKVPSNTKLFYYKKN